MQQPFCLIAEDSDEDYETCARIYRKAQLAVSLERCVNGDQMLAYLYRRGQYQATSRPQLILLDLNMPGTDGREVLATIKQDAGLKTIPCVILTTSSNPRDIADCYRMGANSYMIKPVNLERYTEMLLGIHRYWFKLVSVLS